MSPDGQQIVFDLAEVNEFGADSDLYIINLDGTGQRSLAQNGRSPDWGPGIPGTIDPTDFIFLPILRRP